MKPTILENQAYLDEIAGGYRAAQVLFTACRLGIFERIGKAGESLEAMTKQLQSDRRGTRILLDALVGMLDNRCKMGIVSQLTTIPGRSQSDPK